MNKSFKPEAENLLNDYIYDRLQEDEKKFVENWIKKSEKNKSIYNDVLIVHERFQLLNEMQSYDTIKAKERVERTINKSNRLKMAVHHFQRIAAILIIPVILYSAYKLFKTQSTLPSKRQDIITLRTPIGMHSDVVLPDGSHVWMNTGTVLKYPYEFSGNNRKVEVVGEAYFDVVENKQSPFIVDMGKFEIKVLGTSFNVSNYEEDLNSKVILKSGSILLENNGKQIKKLKPNEKIIYVKSTNKFYSEEVDVSKYTAWLSGKLVFDDDPMNEVVHKLNRWFNVDIILEDQELSDYVYTATFENENMIHILDLLTISAPIKYSVEESTRLVNNTFSKKKVIIKRK